MAAQGDYEWLSYRELAEQLPRYAKDLGFTHIEFLPVSERLRLGLPADPGLYAPTSRLRFRRAGRRLPSRGTRRDARGCGTRHFPDDPHGLRRFDGTVYEHANRHGAATSTGAR